MEKAYPALWAAAAWTESSEEGLVGQHVRHEPVVTE